jgi:hypothetical protein
MNKRLQKRHKRQVARAKDRRQVSEPDLRTPEQVLAAREASRAVGGHRADSRPHFTTAPANQTAPAASDPPVVEAGS